MSSSLRDREKIIRRVNLCAVIPPSSPYSHDKRSSRPDVADESPAFITGNNVVLK